jgi:hypothetical protein
VNPVDTAEEVILEMVLVSLKAELDTPRPDVNEELELLNPPRLNVGNELVPGNVDEVCVEVFDDTTDEPADPLKDVVDDAVMLLLPAPEEVELAPGNVDEPCPRLLDNEKDPGLEEPIPEEVTDVEELGPEPGEVVTAEVPAEVGELELPLRELVPVEVPVEVGELELPLRELMPVEVAVEVEELEFALGELVPVEVTVEVEVLEPELEEPELAPEDVDELSTRLLVDAGDNVERAVVPVDVVEFILPVDEDDGDDNELIAADDELDILDAVLDVALDGGRLELTPDDVEEEFPATLLVAVEVIVAVLVIVKEEPPVDNVGDEEAPV